MFKITVFTYLTVLHQLYVICYTLSNWPFKRVTMANGVCAISLAIGGAREKDGKRFVDGGRDGVAR